MRFNNKTARVVKVKFLSLSFFILFFACNNNRTIAQSTREGETESENKNIKIALLLDTSNSMDGLLEQAKSQLWQLVNELAVAKCDGESPNLEIALYEYGNDRLSAREGYIKQVTPLTDDLDQVSEDLFGLTTNGGSEFCGQVIQTAINQQDWSVSSGDLQIIFIAGNEPFDQGGVNYKKSCANAKEKNIIVNTIHCGSFDEGIQGKWKDGADIAGGSYMCIEQDRKTVYIASPYDDEIAALNKSLNKTYVSYGKLGNDKKMLQVEQDVNAAKYGVANEVKRAVSKSSHFYKNSKWDLVDAAKDKDFELEEVSEEELPEEMKGLDAVEKEKYIKEKTIERENITKQITALNKKRIAYVDKKQKELGNDNMLDKVMIKAMKEQAKSKNFVFE